MGYYTIACLLVPIAMFPLIVIIFFATITKNSRERHVFEDLGNRGVWKSASEDSIRNVSEAVVKKQFNDHYNVRHFLVPAIFLTFIYLVTASIAASFFMTMSEPASAWPYSEQFIKNSSRPLLVAVLGVYLFNMYHTLRRLYLTDLNAHVFWYCLYRTLLVIGMSTVLAFASGEVSKTAADYHVYVQYFGIGFLASDVLAVVLDKTQKWISSRSREQEVYLTSIKGINMWNEYRLSEEGIENVEHLATCDVVELAVKTHYTLLTLLDWVDQAMMIHTFATPQQISLLREKCLVTGVIDLAWMSPECSKSDVNAGLIADVLQINKQFVAEKMNALYQDENVQFIWFLWQSSRELGSRPRSPGVSPLTTTSSIAVAPSTQKNAKNKP